MTGGAGNDTYVVNNAASVAIEAPGGGTDVAWAMADGWTLGDSIEIGALGGTRAKTRKRLQHACLAVTDRRKAALSGDAYAPWRIHGCSRGHGRGRAGGPAPPDKPPILTTGPRHTGSPGTSEGMRPSP